MGILIRRTLVKRKKLEDKTRMEEDMVSIITPVYKCEKLIEETIKCVLNQTYKNWEWLLVDDCTPDNSAEIIKKYQEKDNRIKYFKLNENSGAAIARNKALSESRGRFVAYLDADDLWRNNKLEKQVSFMKENGYAFSCTDYEKIDEKTFRQKMAEWHVELAEEKEELPPWKEQI